MGSLLGNYVHLSAIGYQNAGTYRDESHWEHNVKNRTMANDFDPNIFNKYINALQKKYKQTTLTLNQQALLKLETDYNKKRKDKFQMLKQLKQNWPQLLDQFWHLIIDNANLGKNINAQDIIPFLLLDDNTESGNIDSKLKAFLQSSRGQVKRLQKTNAQNYMLIATIDDRFKKVDSIITTLIQQEKQANPAGNGMGPIESEYDDLSNTWQQYKSKQMNLNSLEQKYNLMQTTNAIPSHAVSIVVGEYFIDRLNALANLSFNLNDITKIMASFAEIMGSIIREEELVPTLAFNQVISMIRSTGLPGLKTTAPRFNQNKSVIALDMDVMEEGFDLQPKGGNNRFKKIIKLEDGSFAFNVDFPTQQKADFYIDIQNKAVGVSMKNTDLSKAEEQYYSQEERALKYPDIKIHEGTSLYVFLLSIQKENLISNIHNHFLNIFAQPPARFGFMRREAADAMLLSLLYSGLTGRGLGKNNSVGGFADILTIEDKSSQLAPGIPRVKFFNITSILDDISSNIQANKQYLYYSPDFYTLLLRNEEQDTAQKRITKLLLETRNIPLSIKLQTRYLKNLP